MRVLLLLISIASFNFTNAQFGGGGGNRQGGLNQGGQQRERPSVREFKASEVAGILNYDASEVIKKVKIKDNALQLHVKKAIVNYNTEINKIALLNKANFDTLNVYVNALIKFRANNRGKESNGIRNNSRELIREKINPVRVEVQKVEKKLNKELELLLDEKQFNKWFKYQKQIKDDLKPNRNENQNSNARGGGNRQSDGRTGRGMRR